MYKDLSHLTDQEVQELMDRYYNKAEDVQKLIEEYKLDVTPGRLAKLFPPEELEETCEYCDTKLVQPRYSRNAKFKSPKYIKCPICGHRPYRTGGCKCENCQDKERGTRYSNKRFRINPKGSKKQRALIEAKYPIVEPTKEYSELNIAHRIILAVLCKEALNEEFKIGPLRDCHGDITHNSSIFYELLEELLNEDILRVDPCSSVYAFPKESFPRVYEMGKVTYRLNIKLPSDGELARDMLLNPNVEIQNEDDIMAIKRLEERLSFDEFVEMMVYEYFIVSDDKTKYMALEYMYDKVRCIGGIGKLLQIMKFATVFLSKAGVRRMIIKNDHDEIDKLVENCTKGIDLMSSNGYIVNIGDCAGLVGPSKLLKFYLAKVADQSLVDFFKSHI